MVTYVCEVDPTVGLAKTTEEIYNALHPEIDEALKALNPGINMTPRSRSWLGEGRRTDFSGVGTRLHDTGEYSIFVYYEPQKHPRRIVIETHLLTLKQIRKTLNAHPI